MTALARSACTVLERRRRARRESALLDLLDRFGVEYVVIGGHAVDAWLEPRFTADIDVTLQADPDVVARLKDVLAERGCRVTREHGADLPSGPDLVRFVSDRESVTFEVQKAKTELQCECLRRAAASAWQVADRLRAQRIAAARGGS